MENYFGNKRVTIEYFRWGRVYSLFQVLIQGWKGFLLVLQLLIKMFSIYKVFILTTSNSHYKTSPPTWNLLQFMCKKDDQFIKCTNKPLVFFQLPRYSRFEVAYFYICLISASPVQKTVLSLIVLTFLYIRRNPNLRVYEVDKKRC